MASFAEIVDPKSTAVLVIDVQNDFCHPEGAQVKMGLRNESMVAVVPHIADLVERARQHGATVVFIRNGNTASTTSEAFRNKKGVRGERIGLRGSWGAEFCGVGPQDGDIEVEKYRYDAFIGTNLEMILRNRGIQTVVITGVTTNTCCETTARHAFVIDFNVVFLSDCTATHRIEEHQATLNIMDQNFAFVKTAQELVREWEAVAPRPLAATPVLVA